MEICFTVPKLALVYLTGPAISDDFVSPPKEVVRGQILWGMGVGVRGRSPLLYVVNGCSVGSGIFLKLLQNDGLN
jgi:hypothetical protein